MKKKSHEVMIELESIKLVFSFIIGVLEVDTIKLEVRIKLKKKLIN
jgi:hypothetical protein